MPEGWLKGPGAGDKSRPFRGTQPLFWKSALVRWGILDGVGQGCLRDFLTLGVPCALGNKGSFSSSRGVRRTVRTGIELERSCLAGVLDSFLDALPVLVGTGE